VPPARSPAAWPARWLPAPWHGKKEHTGRVTSSVA
jgi:hypothetical protein